MSTTREMSVTEARSIEYGIIVLCVTALVLLFQPFSLVLYGIGAGLVVLGGLAFNLVPQCVPGRPLSRVGKVALIVAIVFIVALALAVGSAWLYVLYLQSR